MRTNRVLIVDDSSALLLAEWRRRRGPSANEQQWRTIHRGYLQGQCVGLAKHLAVASPDENHSSSTAMLYRLSHQASIYVRVYN